MDVIVSGTSREVVFSIGTDQIFGAMKSENPIRILYPTELMNVLMHVIFITFSPQALVNLYCLFKPIWE